MTGQSTTTDPTTPTATAPTTPTAVTAAGAPVRPEATWNLRGHDLPPATVIFLVLCATFAWLSSGASLLVTFIPGAVFAWAVLLLLYRGRVELDGGARFLPVYVVALGVQFVHFAEEFVTGFPSGFATLYGGDPYGVDLFVIINMTAYAVFAVAAVAAFSKRLGFLLIPVLFFLMYGTIGNAIAHTWWSIMLGEYFPGLFTAQLFWITGPWALDTLTGGRHRRLVLGLVVAFAAVMIPLLTIFAEPAAMTR